MDSAILQAIQKGSVYAIIPARSGSKGVKNKNICLLHGFPLLSYAIAAAKLVKKIDRVIVSTDSERYAEIARRFGAETPFLRPAEIAGDQATDLEFMQHAIEWLYKNEGQVPEYWVHLRPTNPLRDYKLIDEAVERFIKDDTADSLRSAHPTDDCPFKWFTIKEDGYCEAFGGITLDEANQPRQNFPTIYIPDGYVDVLRSAYIIQNDLLHGDRMIGFCSPKSIDVDHEADFLELEQAVETYQGEILTYLKHCVSEQ